MKRQKKYKIRFRKKYNYVTWGYWREVSDSYLLDILFKLQEKYNFEIISIRLKKHTDGFSCIKIKCNKKDKQKIFTEYCIYLGNNIIELVSF